MRFLFLKKKGCTLKHSARGTPIPITHANRIHPGTLKARKYSINCCVICINLAFSGRCSLKFFGCKVVVQKNYIFQFLFYQNGDNIVYAKLFCK